MEKFKAFSDMFATNFKDISKDATHLFEVNVDKDELWNLYLDSFPEGTNPIYRERREYDCSCCRHFIKTFGNVVVIKDNKVNTIWNFDANDSTFQPVIDTLDRYIREHAVTDIYVSKLNTIGTSKSLERTVNGDIIEYNHFYVELPNKFVDSSYRSVGDIQNEYRGIKDVFKRSLIEITLDSVNTVLDLISSNTLYKGNEWKYALNEFVKYKKDFDKLTDDTERNLFAWEKSLKAGAVVGKIRNHSIGTLLVDISEGMDLDTAVSRYEKITAPSNYKRPKAIFTQKMLDEAKNTLIEMGYMDSLSRRYATLDDITVNNILFSNKDSAKRIVGATDVFAEMSKGVSTKPKQFSKVEEVNVDTFVNNILPTATEVEVYLENKHSDSMVSLIAPAIAESKTMFKWNNNFSWAYSGNMTDSMMKERVKAAGGKVDGDLRFSIQWNDIDTGKDNNDLDAHCITPDGNEIYYANKSDRYTHGVLDVDITQPWNKVAVENITWASRNTMKDGTYKFFVHQFANRGGRNGFRAEIEFDGQIYSFDYPNEVRQDEDVVVAEVTLMDGKFSISEKLPSAVSSKEVWNVNTNQFIPVSVICYSPNYWDEQNGNGNKHIFFMLKDCVNPEAPNGFFNEFLKEDLMKHKRVFEALGGRMKVADTDDQLSGVGFCLTKRNDVVVKVKGNIERMIKVKF